MLRFKKSPEKNNEVKQKIINGRLEVLQEDGDISKVNESITLESYNTLKEEYSKLTKKITDPKSLFELNKYQAIIDFRVLDKNNAHLKLAEHNTHLSKAYKDNPDRNQSIIELGQWNTRYKALPAEQQKKMSASSSLLEGHFSNLTTAVNSYLTQKKYTEALKEMDGLEKSSNSKVVSLYVGIYIAAGNPSAALEHCKNTMEYKGENEKMKEGYCGFYKSLVEQFKAANATAQASEAAKIAESYTTSAISPKIAQAQEEVIKLQGQLASALEKLGNVESHEEIQRKKQELEDMYRKELAIATAKLQDEHNTKMNEMNLQISQLVNNGIPVKPTAPYGLPPAYSSVTNTNKEHQNVAKTKEQQVSYPFNMLDEIIPTTSTGTGPVITTTKDIAGAGTASVATTIISGAGDSSVITADDSKDTKVTAIETIVTNAVPAEINDITTILHSEKPDVNRVAVLCKRAIDKQSDLYKIIDDSVVLLSLTSAYLKSTKLMEAKEAVNKVVNDAIKNDKNAYGETKDSSVLNLIAEEYKEEGLLNKSVEACKKAVSQPGYKPCAESYQLLKEIGETKNFTDKELALDALNVAKDNAVDDIQKYHIHMTIIKMHLTSKKLDDAKKEYKELLNNISYQTVYKLAKTPEEVKYLSAVDDDLAKYKLLFDKYKANPTPEAAEEFYYAISITKCEIKAAALMETNLRLHGPGPTKDIEVLINGNLGNKTISRLNECYKKWDSQITTNDSNAKYVEAIGDIDHCLFGE